MVAVPGKRRLPLPPRALGCACLQAMLYAVYHICSGLDRGQMYLAKSARKGYTI